MTRTISNLFVLLCLLVIISPVHGQLNTATLSGTAADTTGGVLPGATITLTQVDTGRVRTTITNDEGRYVASSLAARGRSTFSELRWYPPMEAAKGSMSWVFRAKQPESVRTGP